MGWAFKKTASGVRVKSCQGEMSKKNVIDTMRSLECVQQTAGSDMGYG